MPGDINKKKGYLGKNKLISKFGVIVYSLIALFVAVILLTRSLIKISSPVSIFVVIILFAPILFILKKQIANERYSLFRFAKGIKGEEMVTDVLENMGGDFQVFRNVLLPNLYGDIDFVIVGKAGVFALDAKSINGVVSVKDRELMVDGRELEKDYLNQVKKEALELSKFIKINAGLEVFVKPVLVFSGFAKMHFGLKPVEGVYLVNKEYLEKLFSTFGKEMGEDGVERIVSVLKSV